MHPAATSVCSFGQVSPAPHSGQGEGQGTRTLWEKGQGEGRVAGRPLRGPPGGQGQKHPCHCDACGAGVGLLMTDLGAHSWVEAQEVVSGGNHGTFSVLRRPLG